MTASYAEARSKVERLVERFARHLDAYRRADYKEAQVRTEFIDPLFEALGWDVRNVHGYAEQYKDVIHEDAIKVGGATRAPDYCFRIGGVRKFFLEAKKPSVWVKGELGPAYQLRRYAWSAKLPLSILTDFEEFAVYDCLQRPSPADKPGVGRVTYLTFDQYAERFDDVYGIFGKESVLQGSFDRYVQDTKRKHGTSEVDAEFLKEIEGWRDALAHNVALRNPALSVHELNYAVQRTIDRLIFLRMCEDRGIEDYGRLLALTGGPAIYARLGELYRQADEKYDSDLFDFQADTLSKSLAVDDRVLKPILAGLYYPQSPYEFSVLPTEILGQVYEQFLGKVIRLTSAHRAVVEEKPEVKKAGGVYYTPAYIVDYIVRQTVGRLVEDKTPRQISKLRILDGACGSGSFLLGAYQYLLDYHLQWYGANDPAKHAQGRQPAVYQGPHGEWRLTTAEKKRILLNNVYGVDIDRQAVEVTRLSLLLKVLEGENQETLGQQLALWRERALPDLASNVKCGNSLIGPDYFGGQLLPDEEEMRRVNPFDWEAEFPEIMAAGGFDCVIGNPPYVFGRDWRALNISDGVKEYLGTRYKSSPYQLDMFSIFMEKASRLCKLSGRVGLIVPNVWLTNMYSSSTRAFVLSHAQQLCIVTPLSNVFPGLTVDTIVYTFKKGSEPDKTFQVKAMREGDVFDLAAHDTQEYLDGQRPISTALDRSSADLVFRLKENYPDLQDFARITRGVHPYRTGGYGQTAFGSGPQTESDVRERPYHSKTEKAGYRPFVYGRDLRRLAPVSTDEFVNYGPWLAEPRSPEFFEGERVYSRKILGERLIVTVETSDSVADQQVYITKPIASVPSASYLAGILGSKLTAFFIRGYYNEANDAFPQIKVGQLKSLPIPSLNFADPADVAQHDKMVALVERMLELHKKLAAATIPADKTLYQRQIGATDRQIDALVYELYGLTEEEIAIVEGHS